MEAKSVWGVLLCALGMILVVSSTFVFLEYQPTNAAMEAIHDIGQSVQIRWQVYF